MQTPTKEDYQKVITDWRKVYKNPPTTAAKKTALQAIIILKQELKEKYGEG
jgi:hypothetical protein